MRPRRHLGFALWLALALVVGQQAAALHALGHATEKASRKNEATPAKTQCETCTQLAGFSGAMGAHVQVPPTVIAHAPRALIKLDASIRPAQHLAFHPRAPPTLL